MKTIPRTHCSGDCPGHPQLARTSQAFTRRGSLVEVIISRIPATVCPVCGQSFVEEETAQRVEALVRPFHGGRGAAPALPAAKVYIDFEEAGKKRKAA
jgi:YgiT-type zinc finger domain-containing protein